MNIIIISVLTHSAYQTGIYLVRLFRKNDLCAKERKSIPLLPVISVISLFPLRSSNLSRSEYDSASATACAEQGRVEKSALCHHARGSLLIAIKMSINLVKASCNLSMIMRPRYEHFIATLTTTRSSNPTLVASQRAASRARLSSTRMVCCIQYTI